jgi:hypothetical protein
MTGYARWCLPLELLALAATALVAVLAGVDLAVERFESEELDPDIPELQW